MNQSKFSIRKKNINWSISLIKGLLNQIKIDKNSTILSYVALECRITIEYIEAIFLIMPLSSLETNTTKAEFEKFKGINKLNKKAKTLCFRYQSFSVAFTDIFSNDIRLVPFNLRKAESLEKELANYIHIYGKNENDYLYESDFVKRGIKTVEDTLHFLESSFPLQNGYAIQGTIDFTSLHPKIKDELQDWLKRKDEDITQLKERLQKIKNDFHKKNYTL